MGIAKITHAQYVANIRLIMANTRYIKSIVEEYLEDRMVLIGGPRQVGKTTFSTNLLGAKGIKSPAYYNWDNLDDRENIKKNNNQH